MRGFARFGIVIMPLLTGTAYGQCDITQKVCALKGSFNPAPIGGNNPDNKSPQCDSSQPVSTAEIADAFGVASPTVKGSLCNLTQIFISADADWGRWNDPRRHRNDNPDAAYVTIDQGQLNN